MNELKSAFLAETLTQLVPITAAEKNMRNNLSNRKSGQEHKSKASATLKL